MAENGNSNEVAAQKEFKSKLSTGRTKFLAHAVDNALTSGRRTAQDFIRLFPPRRIMEALSTKAELRARILVETTGTRHRVAVQKSAESAGEDLQIALDVGETNAADIVALFRPDDRVRYLDARELWAFIAEGEFWKKQLDVMALEISRSHIGYMIDRAMDDKLLKARDVIDGIGVDRLAEVLPRAELGWMLAKALESGRGRKPFTDEMFLAEAPIGVLADHVPLAELWERVLYKHVAVPQGFAEEQTRESAVPGPAKSESATSAAAKSESPPAPLKSESTVAAVSFASIADPSAAPKVEVKGDAKADQGKSSSKSSKKSRKKKSSDKKADEETASAPEAEANAAPFDFSDVTASEEIEEAVVAAAVKASEGS